jgi:predicted nucleic acid-binding protein
MGPGMGSVSEGHVIDSNILIYHINGQLDSDIEQTLYGYFEQSAYISTITVMEVLSWPRHSDESVELTTAFLKIFDEIAIDAEIKILAIRIRRNYRLKLPDAIIAATALHLGLPLITRNVKDFEVIPDLMVINPFGNVALSQTPP